MQSSSLLKKRQMCSVSTSVLRLINNKMYPLNQERMRKLHKKRLKSKIVKVHTEPTEPHETVSLTASSSHISSKIPTFHDFEERTMGEHFSQLETRGLMFSRLQNKDYSLASEKINEFIWTKRREIKCSLSSKKEGKITEIEHQKQAVQLHKSHLRRNGSSVQHCLVRLRKKLKEQFARESEAFETPIRFSEAEEQERPRSRFNFLDNEGMERVMERYPINDSGVRVVEDANKQFENDILEEIKNNQNNDKYARMRISINHRKIVSLR